MVVEFTTEELVEILLDWHKYAHGVGKIGYCNNDKCQAALDEIKRRILPVKLDKEWLEQKADRFLDITNANDFSRTIRMLNAEEFIGILIKEAREKK